MTWIGYLSPQELQREASIADNARCRRASHVWGSTGGWSNQIKSLLNQQKKSVVYLFISQIVKMPQGAALIVSHWIVFWGAHVPLCVHRVVQLPPASACMQECRFVNIKSFQWCYLTTGATLAPQLNTELVSWARADRLRVTSLKIASIWRFTWGSPHNSNPK